MAIEAEKIIHGETPQKELDVKDGHLKKEIEILKKYAKESLGGSRILKSPDLKKEKQFDKYLKKLENREKFGELLNEIKNTQDYPFRNYNDEKIIYYGTLRKVMGDLKLPKGKIAAFLWYMVASQSLEKERNIEPEDLWKAINRGFVKFLSLGDEYEHKPSGKFGYHLTEGILYMLSLNEEKGKEFIEKVGKAFAYTLKKDRKERNMLIRNGVVVDENGSEYPFDAIVNPFSKDEVGGMFKTSEKAFNSFLDFVKENYTNRDVSINDWIKAAEGISLIESAIHISTSVREIGDLPISEVYRTVAHEIVSHLKTALNEIDKKPEKGYKKWEELKKKFGYVCKEFFDKMLKTYYGHLNNKVKEMFWRANREDTFNMWIDPEIFLGAAQNKINEKEGVAGVSKMMGSILYQLKERGKVSEENLPSAFKIPEKWSIPKMMENLFGEKINYGKLEEKNVFEEDKTNHESEFSIYKKITNFFGEAIDATLGAFATASGYVISQLIDKIYPQLVNDIGKNINFTGNPHLSGIVALTAVLAVGSYGVLKGIYESIADVGKEIQENREVKKLSKEIENIAGNYLSIEKIPEKVDNKEHYKSFLTWLNDYGLPLIEERIENIYQTLRKLEDKGYLPSTIEEIYERYDKIKNKVFEIRNANSEIRSIETIFQFPGSGIERYA